MAAQPELTQVERDKLEINPDFDFREIAKRPFEEITPNELSMFKWSGVYHQLQPSFFMIRVVTPGGLMTTKQFRRAVDLAEEFAQGELCITTRQTLQFHWIRKEDIYKIIEGMADVGITTKNGCGDVPRNIIGSSLAGASQEEIGDSYKIIQMLATDHEIRDLQRNLPRKHKISVAFANEAGAQTLMNCQGWVPVKRGDTVGWKFHAGGGLGARPYLAKVIFDWVPEELVLPVAQATVEAFRRHGDRRQRAFARLKIVVDKMGSSGFADVLLDIMKERGVRGLEKIEKAASPIPNIGRMVLNGQEVIPQKQAGLSVVRVMIPRSELKTAQSRTIARLADELGGGKIMFTNRQNMEFHDVPERNVPALLDALHTAGFRTSGHEHLPDIVACVGTTMCKMAVADCPDVYHRLYDALAGDEKYWRAVGPLRINITGCPNNCAHAWIADIGLRGKRTRNESSGSTEGYTVFVGGKLSEAGKIGEQLCDVDAAEIVPAVKKILDAYLKHRLSQSELFTDFCERIGIAAFRNLVK
ncbi:MAG TPA: nitrite/sulfite reductase [Pontiellaceae bacterium]|nr:nitrite/sulfite reductase [Pontiellaceae bacterium]HPR83130.1 nitrite/sulfite reductase [Pontiellaceae bacterium]